MCILNKKAKKNKIEEYLYMIYKFKDCDILYEINITLLEGDYIKKMTEVYDIQIIKFYRRPVNC